LYLWLDVFCLQAYAAFAARTNVTVMFNGQRLVTSSAKAIPTLTLASYECLAPGALVRPSLAIAERNNFDCRSSGSFGLYGQRFDQL
jgi:hypothetical protein